MLLLMVADCLAAQNALALHGQSAGDQSSPWSSDQESMIKVKHTLIVSVPISSCSLRLTEKWLQSDCLHCECMQCCWTHCVKPRQMQL